MHSNPNKEYRWFGFTNFNCWETDYNVMISRHNNIKYIALGEEVCPTTKKKHHQGFLYLSSSRKGTFAKTLGKWFGNLHVHCWGLDGKVKQSEAYCSKESKLVKFGEEPKQGARGDLDETKTAILEGSITAEQVLISDPMMYHMYGRTLEKLEAVALRKKYRSWMTSGIWYYGPTQTGKSARAFEGFKPETHYVKNLNEDWWDGYTGQETIIFNEFRGQICYSEMLDLLDRYPKTVKIRNREPVPFLGKKIIITSCKHPQDVYYKVLSDVESFKQFERRVKIISTKKQAEVVKG